jgi:hypothetical protein
MKDRKRKGWGSTCESAQKFLFVHVVFECFASVNENNRNLVVELAAKFGVEVDIHFVPGETAATRELREALFNHFAQMASLAGIDHDAARIGHARKILARRNGVYPAAKNNEKKEQFSGVGWLDQAKFHNSFILQA